MAAFVHETDDGLPDTSRANFIELNELSIVKTIGEGSFGSVFLGDYLGTLVAVKQINSDMVGEDNIQKYLNREEAIHQFSHPHLVQFIGVCRQQAFVYLVTEFMDQGDLRTHLKSPRPLPWGWRVNVASDVARGMAFLHSKKIMHRDLKSKNLLLDARGRTKVCDFGFARSFGERKRLYTCCGTEDWMAPEIVLGMDYNEKSDVFSYGIVLAEIITRKKASRELQRGPQNCFEFEVDSFKALVPDDCPPAFVTLTIDCCKYEPEARPAFTQILDTLKKIVVPEPVLPARADAVPTVAGSTAPVAVRGGRGGARGGGSPLATSPSRPAGGPLTPQRSGTGTGASSRGGSLVAPSTPSRSISSPAAPTTPAPPPPGISISLDSAVPTDRPLPTPVPVTAAASLAANSRQKRRSIYAVDRTSRFSWFKRSPSSKLQSDSRSEAIAKLGCSLRFDDTEKFVFALEDVLAPNCLGGWVLVSYVGPTTLSLSTSGVKVADLVAQLNDTQIQYMLVRVRCTIAKDSVLAASKSQLTRDVFIQWIGPNVAPMEKGKKIQHIEELKKVFSPFHATLTAVSKERFNLESILEKSAPLSGSHVID